MLAAAEGPLAAEPWVQHSTGFKNLNTLNAQKGYFVVNIDFTKMHGLGNDFILIDCRYKKLANPSVLSKALCHRRFGIGADQILLLYPSRTADFRMKIFNADGSEVEMCGNGIRCLAKYIWDRNLSKKKVLEIETLAGMIRPEKKGRLVRVDMGEPVFEPGKIPVKIIPPHPALAKGGTGGGVNSSPIIDYPLQIKDRKFKITCVSMGNPHVVIFVDNISDFPVTYYGPLIEKHGMFPRKINVEFIQRINRSDVKMRVWERGSGETMACGTGASASAVASSLKGLTGRKVTVHLMTGDLLIDWAKNNHVYMTGPATEVFNGIIKI